jgi:PPM family protein phosphatase
MSSLTPEQAPEQPLSKREYVAFFEKYLGEIHEGTPAVTGLERAGQERRKEICEDVKLKNREKGVFLVADGVSKANGWAASRETARVVYETLGESLDQGVENIVQEALKKGEHPLERVTQYVATQMIAAVGQAHSKIKVLGANPEFRGAATTLSLTKLIELPDANGKTVQRMFYLNIGDSRIYISRNKNPIERITNDDSLLHQRVLRDEVTPEEAEQVDQVEDPQTLPPELRELARSRNVITKAVGYRDPSEGLEVSYVDVQPGNRIVIVSDGISDQLLNTEMDQLLRADQSDAQHEQALEQAAMRMSLEGKKPRAKGDDISAVVQTIGERGPDRSYLHQEKKTENSREVLLQARDRWREAYQKVADQIALVDQRINTLDDLTPKRERLALLSEREGARSVLAQALYQQEQAELDLIDDQIPPRHEVGSQVRIWRQDFSPPRFDHQPWTVAKYDHARRVYELRGAGNSVRSASRYVLDSEGGVAYRELGNGERHRRKMIEASKAYYQAKETQKAYQAQQIEVMRMEAMDRQANNSE